MLFSRYKNENVKMIGRAITLALLFVIIVFTVLYVINLNFSLGWFSIHGDLNATGMQVAVSTDKYDILINRTNEFDTLLPPDNEEKYSGISAFKALLAGDPYGYNLDSDAVSVIEDGRLAFELHNEIAYVNEGLPYYYLMPGSCGTLTFYLRPVDGQNVVAGIDFLIDSFVNTYDGDTPIIAEVTDPAVLDLLKGHILLFTERNGTEPENYKYNGLIDNGHLTYDTSEHTLCSDTGKTDCYKIVVYWEWPMTYSELSEGIGSSAWANKYPPELADYIDDNREFFFATNKNSSVTDELDDGYNDGDQIIGEHADYITVVVTCD